MQRGHLIPPLPMYLMWVNFIPRWIHGVFDDLCGDLHCFDYSFSSLIFSISPLLTSVMKLVPSKTFDVTSTTRI